jgi:general secretion pathway protein D
MRVRLLPVGLLSAGLLIAAAFYPALAKPPQLPVQEKIDCEEECQEAPVVQDHQAAPTCPVCPAGAAKPGEKSKLITKVYPVADLVIPIGQNSHVGLPADVNECCQEAKPIPAPVKQATIATDTAKECTSCCPACASAGCCPKSTTTATAAATSQAKQVTHENHLIQLIEQTIQPKTWDAKGGAGIIDYYPITMSLAISQTAAAHEEIAELLASLRRELDTQVSVEVRFISVSEESMGRLGMNCPAGDKKCQEKKETCEAKGSCTKASSAGCDDAQPVKFLSAVEVRQIMEALQADAKTNIMQAPKMTMLNGQEAMIEVCEMQRFTTGVTIKQPGGQVLFDPQYESYKTGTEMNVQPVVSSDHRIVRVKVNANLTSVDGPGVAEFPVITFVQQKGKDHQKDIAYPVRHMIQVPRLTKLAVDKMLNLPDGGTAFITVGKRPCEKAVEAPVLSKVPYIDRLFHNDGCKKDKQTEVVIMMLTPRIIVSEQEEVALNKCITSCSKEKVVKNAMPLADHEEQEIAPSPKQPCSQATLTPAHTVTSKAAKLVKQYRRACVEGDSAKATELAIKALAIDPMCFGKK